MEKEKKLEGHLVGFGTLQEMEEYEDWIYLGGAMSERRYNAYDDTPSKDECDKLCAEFSGEVKIFLTK
ncbi:hypothetical protein SAMN05216232_3921 [Virgibacillus subterraneus]|uniref:Uncharacterized protein n=1 Tax=Virgibacillus subterraneus TaxID=621109 RepID=A0A1H9KLP5_9BACI|nr:hypothetical protein [Virgibacillus subterraneus]SER00091.1 hypothetical protein SAMN05216232_3921 [Virgibacillus subterraneus]